MEVYLGTICAFGFGFAPVDWVLCCGQTALIAQNTTLFTLLGTSYGGDGRSTFGLPDMRGRAAMGMDSVNYYLGDTGGTESLTITPANLPPHIHTATVTMHANSSSVSTGSPAGNYLGNVSRDGDGTNALYDSAPTGTMAQLPFSLAAAGANTQGVTIDSRRPYLAMNYAIALYGYYPSRY